MHDDRVDERIREALAGADGIGRLAGESDPVGAVRTRVVRRRRRRLGAVGTVACAGLLAVGLIAATSMDSGSEDVRTAAREVPAQGSRPAGSAGVGVVATECRDLAEETGTQALASMDYGGLCAVLDATGPEGPQHGSVRFFLDGAPVGTVGLDPCPIPEAFAVPSSQARPVEDGNGHRVTGTLPVPAGEVRAALEPIAAVGDRLTVDYFPELETSVYVIEQAGGTTIAMDRTLDKVDAATAPLTSSVSSPECALQDVPQDAEREQSVTSHGCATRMLEVAAGDDWTLRRGVDGRLPSLYEVSVGGEPVFGGCADDLSARDAGFLPWFSVHVNDAVLLFGEVPADVSAVAVNGEVVEAVVHEGPPTGMVVVALPHSDEGFGSVTLEAVWADGTRAGLPPARIDPSSNLGFVLNFTDA